MQQRYAATRGGPGEIAMVYVGLREYERAFEWLARAVEDGSSKWRSSGTLYDAIRGSISSSADRFMGAERGASRRLRCRKRNRGVSRRYVVTMHDNVWSWSRNAPGFSKRFSGTLVENGGMMIGKGELSRDVLSWEKDVELTYTRIES
jgi:hypothetical protein